MIFAGIFGDIEAIKAIGGKYGKIDDPGTGFVYFVNNLLGILTSLAGILVVVNLIAAGYLYLSSNNEPQKIQAAGNKILQTIIGIGVVAMAYVIAAILGAILYNDSTKLLKPTLFVLP